MRQENNMWKKIAIGGAIGAAALGTGTAALAASGGTTPSSPASSATSGAKHPGKALARRALHGQWVTGKAGSSTFVTHDLIKGDVTAVSGSSVTVTARDKASQTYVVNSATKVRQRSAGKGTPSTITAVHVGDHVLVVGTGTTTLTATGIVEVKK
jgi:hypothetical protein